MFTVSRATTHVLLALLDCGIAVRVGDLGGFAQASGDDAVDESEDGNGAQGDANDGAGSSVSGGFTASGQNIQYRRGLCIAGLH